MKTAYTEPKPLKWSSKNAGCDHIVSWTFKRNYKATLEDIDGDRFRYSIYETSSGVKPTPVLEIESSKFPYDHKERVESLVRIMAKGKIPKLNKFEKELIEKVPEENYYNQQAIIFIPYNQ